MERRILLLPILTLSLTACASMRSWMDDEAPPVSASVDDSSHPRTPDQAYFAGLLMMQRGDPDRARREWNRCLAISSADSPYRFDCLVALEKLSAPGTLMP